MILSGSWVPLLIFLYLMSQPTPYFCARLPILYPRDGSAITCSFPVLTTITNAGNVHRMLAGFMAAIKELNRFRRALVVGFTDAFRIGFISASRRLRMITVRFKGLMMRIQNRPSKSWNPSLVRASSEALLLPSLLEFIVVEASSFRL